MMLRRDFLRLGGALPMLSLGAGLLPGQARAADNDYRALVCLFLTGGNDGHNSIVPIDGAYADYERARSGLALPRESLAAMDGGGGAHRFGMHPALAPLAALYNEQRLAWMLNAGPLVRPASARQVRERAVAVPSFLLSHSDQVMWQQGWLGDTDSSGWAGRAMELLPSALRQPLGAVTMSTNRTLVTGRASPVAFLSAWDARYWGAADLAQPGNAPGQALNRMAQWQSANQYEAEYARTLGRSVAESTIITRATLAATAPAGQFADDDLGRSLRKLAMLMPVFKRMGYRRQVFLVQWGNLDTHANQRGTLAWSQDSQLDQVARALAAFDQSNRAAGLDDDVVTLMQTDFGRTLRQASGGGSDHAWGNHWFALGGPVAGGQVYGELPSLVLGGADDADLHGAGRFVPGTSTDQVGATVMRWLGLPDGQLLNAFPNLAHFTTPHLDFLRA